MLTSVLFLQTFINNMFNQMIQLILSILCGVMIYTLCSFLLEKETINELTINELKSLVRI